REPRPHWPGRPPSRRTPRTASSCGSGRARLSSTRLSSANVFSPFRIRWTVARLNSVLNTRLPSAFLGCSPIGPPVASYVPTVSSRNGEHSADGARAGGLAHAEHGAAVRSPSARATRGSDGADRLALQRG